MPSDPMGDAIQEALDAMAWERAIERGEVSDEPVVEAASLEQGVYTVGADGELTWVGTSEEVTDEIAAAYERAFAEDDPIAHFYENQARHDRS